MDQKRFGLLAGLLLLALIGAIIWGLSQKSQLAEVSAEREAIDQELGQMSLLRDGLANQVDSLSAAYERAAQDNEALAGSLANSQEQLEAARRSLAQVRADKEETVRSAYNIRVQIDDLLKVRAQLEDQIIDIQAENDSLRRRNVALQNELSGTRNDRDALARLNESMQREIEALTLDNFKATAFQVEAQRGNNDRLTSRGRRTRRIKVEFDLADVPAEYQGVRTLYLVITDGAGTPIPTESPITATATVNGATMNLRAQEARDYNIEASQRITFTHELDSRLDAGYYRAQVFTDIGLLGASSFHLD